MNARIEKRIDYVKNMTNDAYFYERMTLLEQAYTLYQDEETGRRYADAFYYVLKHMALLILDDELIVGGVKEIIPTAEQQALYDKVISRPGNQNDMQWGNSFDSLLLQKSEEWVERYAPEWFVSYGHHTESWPLLLQKGFGGIRAFMQERLEHDDLNADQRVFYENGVIICNAYECYAARYAALARTLAQSAPTEQRRAELQQIAENLDRVPMQPARTFYEALQAVWLVQMINSNVCGARDYAFGRMDQYLLPYYEADLAAGRLDHDRALELIESFYVKINEIIGYCVYNYHPKRSLCNHSLQYIYISGTDDAGHDATNALSYLFLEACAEVRMQQPTLYIHYHEQINRDFLHKAVAVTREGRGDPCYYNDAKIVEALINTDVVTPEDARHFTHYGCNNINLDSQEDEIREIWNIMPKFVELALNGGHDMLTGRLLTYESKPAEEITSYDELFGIVQSHLEFALEASKKITARSDATVRKNKTFSAESLLLPDCLAQGIDMTRMTRYKHCNVHCAGIATCGDSLYAIDRLVFRENRMSLAALRDILRADWAGHEALRSEILTQFPKFGNDLDEVDCYAVRFGEMFCHVVKAHSPIQEDNGITRMLIPTFYSLDHATPMGRLTAASADGRHAGEPISENQSPVYGVMRNGPTAALNSVAKLPFRYTPGGGLNVKMQKELLAGDGGVDVLQGLLEGYFRQGGLHMQIMVNDQKVLEDARLHPEKYRDLLVRVTGYSAYFVTLSPDEQDEIVRRSSL